MAKFLSNINLEAANDLQFKTTAGTNAGKISQTGNDLVLSNPVGDILLGDGTSDIYVGDGINSVDILFEQSGSIKADDSASGVTLTLGSSNTTLTLVSPTITGTITDSSSNGLALLSGAQTFTGQKFFDAGFEAHPIMLSGSQNFDNIDRSGFYNLYNTSSGSTNPPPGGTYGTMFVIGNDKQSNGFGVQLFHQRTGGAGQLQVRGMNDSGSTWTSWNTVYTSADTATIADGGTGIATADQIHTFVTGFNYSTATGVADNADVTPSWVPANDPSYLTSETSHADVLVDGDFNGNSGFMKTDGSGNYSIDTSTYITGYTVTTSDVKTALNADLGGSMTIGDSNDTVTFGEDVIVTGDLTVNGSTVTVDTTNLNVQDKNITLNYSTGDSSSSADGAGITIQDAVDASNDATMLWNASNDKFTFSHAIVANGVALTGDQTLPPDLTVDGAGTVHANNYTDTQYSTVSSSAAGLAPQLPSSHGGKFLKADGTYAVPSYTTETYTAHENISAATSVNGSGRQYIQDITVDGNGHVTSIATATETVVNTDTNKFLSGITKPQNSNTVTFAVTNGTDQTFTFGSNAFNSTTIPTGNAIIDWSTSGEEAVIHSSYYTDTVYTHPNYTTTNIDTTGSTIVDSITTNSTGHITAMGTRTLTLSDLGFSGNSAANCVLNASQTLTNKTIDADNNTISDLVVSNFKASAVVIESEGIGSNDNDTTIPTSAAVKDYVDNNSSSANYYLDGITKSSNTLTFSVNGATDQTYEFGANAFNSTTIPTNTNQLTNGANFITASSNITGTAAGLSATLAVGSGGTGATSLDAAGIVEKTGTQTIGGTKTFTGSLLLDDGVGASPTMRFMNADDDEVSIFCNPSGKMKFQQKLVGGSNVVQMTMDENGLDIENGLTVGTGTTITTILDEDDMASNSATALATQQSIKAYVTSSVAGAGGGTMSNFLLAASGTAGTATIDQGETITFSAGTGITATRSGNQINIANSAPAGSTHLNSNTTKSDVGLSNVENTALSTYTGSGGALDNQYITNGANYTTNTGTTTASNTQTFTNKTIDANGTGNSITNIDIGNMTAAVIVTESEGIGNNDNDTTIPTSAAVIDYVASNAGQTYSVSVPTSSTKLRLTASGGTTDDIEFAGGTDISVTRVNGSKLSIAYTGAGGYTLPTAASNVLGGVKIGYSENGRNYPVELDSDQMYVNVPWADNNTTYTAGSLLDLSGTQFNVDLTEATAATIAAGDNIIFIDGGATGTQSKGSIDDVATLFAGGGLSATNGVLSVNLGNGLSLDVDTIKPAVHTNIGLDSSGIKLNNNVYNAAMKIGRASTGQHFDFTQSTHVSMYSDTTEEYRFTYEGEFHADGDVKAFSQTIASDKKLKKNIRPLDQYGLDEVLKLKPVMYDWKKEKRGYNNIGFIAQDVQEVIPELVNESVLLNGEEGETKLGVEYSKMVAVLTKAIQDQQKQIDELKKLINGNTK